MSALEEVITAFNLLLKADTDLGDYVGQFTWDDGSQSRAVFLGVAPDGVTGCYVVVRAEEHPGEDPGRKRLWYAVDVFDDSMNARKVIGACKRIEVLLRHADVSVAGGHLIRVWLDVGPLQVPEEAGQHWSMDFVIEYSDNQAI